MNFDTVAEGRRIFRMSVPAKEANDPRPVIAVADVRADPSSLGMTGRHVLDEKRPVTNPG